jgi:Amt family ammonium transporter
MLLEREQINDIKTVDPAERGTDMMAMGDRSIVRRGRTWAAIGVVAGVVALLGAGGIAHAGEQGVAPVAAPAQARVDTGDTAWVLVSAALVMLMTPGLAFFYGGLVRRKNMLSVLMQCLMILCLISLQWVAFGYSLSFGPGNAVVAQMAVP